MIRTWIGFYTGTAVALAWKILDNSEMNELLHNVSFDTLTKTLTISDAG